MKEEYLSIDTITRLVELEKENKELKEQIEMLVKDDEEMQKTIIDLSRRIDKAIKEIDYLIGNCDLTDYQGQKIKNILRGENDGGL